MVGQLRHRGPDDHGVHIDDDIALGHDRLSILDLSDRAAQPMRSSCDRFVISYNGEIYNFRSLRRGLEQRGRTLRSTGDTEVLVEHLAEFGVAATLPRLEGDWAFALWDRQRRQLVLARDRHGVKPLYYRIDAGTVWFASEMKVLVPDDVRADMSTVGACLLGHAGTWGERTVFEGIRSVLPGEALCFSDPSQPPQRETYARIPDFLDRDLSTELDAMPPDAVVDRVDRAFSESVSLRMVSDAPLACLASGGVDSSLIASVASQQNPDLALFHADVTSRSEREAAEELSRALGLPLHVATVDDDHFLHAVAAATYANDVPLTYHFNSVPFFIVSELARREGVKVLLTGEGSDEYFLGYPHLPLAPVLDAVAAFRATVGRAARRRVPRLAKQLLATPELSYPVLLGKLLTRFETEEVGAAAWDELLVRDAHERRSTTMSLELLDAHLLSLLHRNDRLGMAWSLESRFPFLGHELARLALNLPGRYKLRRSPRMHDSRHPFTVDKWVVRELAARHVPRELATRPKRGFQVSIADRLAIDPDYFVDGFVVDAFGLTPSAMARALAAPEPRWPARLVLVDVWGRLFVHDEPVEAVQDRLSRFVSVEAR